MCCYHCTSAAGRSRWWRSAGGSPPPSGGRSRSTPSSCPRYQHTQCLADVSSVYQKLSYLFRAWNNGKEVPRWGVAEIQKTSPSTTGRCSRHAAAMLSADQLECGMATWHPITRSYYICCPGVVGRSVFAVQAWSNL